MTRLIADTPYAQTAPAGPDTLPLHGHITADAVIIGAGYSGLTAALGLVGRGMRVVLLEAGDLGHGGAGLNHGHCTPIFHYLDENQLPPTGFALLRDAGQRVFDLIEHYQIACEARQAGALTAAHTPAALDRIARQRARYAALGKASPLLDRDAMAEITGSRAFLGGWVHAEGGHLNPLAYVRGLARAALAEGVIVHTRSPALAIAPAHGHWRVETPLGSVTAPRLGLAVNAYGAGPTSLANRAEIPVEAYGLASAPLAPDRLASILPRGHTLGDTRHDPRFLRLDAQGRIIAGGLLELGRGRRPGMTVAHMNDRFERLFPGIGPLTWTHLWRGRLSFTTARAPRLYRLGENFLALSGFSGRGVPTATALGAVLAEALWAPQKAPELWPVIEPRSLPARRLLGFAIQTSRGPANRIRDWWEARRGQDDPSGS